MTALRVLHVEAGLHLYGGALQVLYLLRGLHARGHSNILVCPPGSAIAQAAAPYADILTPPMRGDLDLPLIVRLRNIIRAQRPDLVHLHSRRGADVLGGVAARWAGVPCVLTRRVDNPEAPSWARRKYTLYQHVVTISEGIRRVLITAGVPADQLSCVPSAVDTTHYRPDGGDRAHLAQVFADDFTLSAHAPVLAMLAQFIPRKGHAHLLAALPAVLAVVPDLQVLLFGRGPLEPALRAETAARGLTATVHFGGFRDDLHQLLPAVDVLVHPAEMEGLGVSLLQAAACALPIIACPVGGIPEVVEDGVTGLHVPVGDHRALASALITLLQHPDQRRALGATGRLLVESRFSLNAMVEGNIRVYRAVLGGAGQKNSNEQMPS